MTVCISPQFLLCLIFLVTVREVLEWTTSHEIVWGKEFFDRIDGDSSGISDSGSSAERTISAALWNALAWDPVTVRCQVYHNGSFFDEIPEFSIEPGSGHQLILIRGADVLSCVVSWRTRVQSINIRNDDRAVYSQWKFDEDGLYKNVSSEYVFYGQWRW